MAELIAHARRHLVEVLTETFRTERARFDDLLPAAGELSSLAGELRSAASSVRALSAVAG
jgi:hypothetical protein